MGYDDFLIVSFHFFEAPLIISWIFFSDPPPSRDVDLSNENIIAPPPPPAHKYNMSNSWEELLLTEGLTSLYVSELDLYLKNHSLPWEKKLKKEKLELITTHFKETRAEALRTMTVTGQRLLQEPEAAPDDDDDDDDEGDDTALGETRSEESESEESECEEGDESAFEPLAKRPCSTRSGRHASSFIL